jgi:hypothetical protein
MHGVHCNKNPIYVFLFWELRGLSPNFHIQVSVSDLYIPMIGPHISCSRIGIWVLGINNRSQTHECGNWDCGREIPFLGIFVSNFRYGFFAVVWCSKSCCFLNIGEDWILTGLRSSSFWFPRNLSHHMIKQVRTGDTVLVKSREIARRRQTLLWWLGGRRGKDDRKQNTRTLAPYV